MHLHFRGPLNELPTSATCEISYILFQIGCFVVQIFDFRLKSALKWSFIIIIVQVSSVMIYIFLIQCKSDHKYCILKYILHKTLKNTHN